MPNKIEDLLDLNVPKANAKAKKLLKEVR